MKRIIFLLLLTTVVFISGCGILEETQNSLNYATETTEYLNEMSTYGEEVQTLLNEGNVNIAEVETTLTELEETVEEFNKIEVPAIAEGIHTDILANNEKLLDVINQIQENGEIAIDELKNSEIFQTIDSITNFMNQIEQLGFES
ncbi:DUF6376 family protein, partial [Paucisalibacillus sp. EB02]|uniref:DUF6376 family protein n=1 Tax=Paucisalibacillus sp. EB02 TaxID=1347087 RepID=UPI0005A5E596